MSRLAACASIMERDDVDALVLGREANARAVSGAARLWLAGTRVFSPGCVVVRRDGRADVHVLANTDAVMPPGFPTERLYGVTWNPEKLVGSLVAIDGLGDARRIGVDGMTPAAHALLRRVAPSAELVDAARVFAELWATPDGDTHAGVTYATEIARTGLEAMGDQLLPGVTPRILRGACAAAIAANGVTTPAFEAVAAAVAPGASTWLSTPRTFAAGERVVLRAGAICDGWEGSAARTYVVGSPSVEQPPPPGRDALVAACVAGARVGSLRERGAVVFGAGRGVEPWPDGLVLAPGHMVSLEVRDARGVRQEIVAVR